MNILATEGRTNGFTYCWQTIDNKTDDHDIKSMKPAPELRTVNEITATVVLYRIAHPTELPEKLPFLNDSAQYGKINTNG